MWKQLFFMILLLSSSLISNANNFDEFEKLFTQLSFFTNKYTITFKAEGKFIICNENYPMRNNRSNEIMTVPANTPVKLYFNRSSSISFYNWENVPHQDINGIIDIKQTVKSAYFIYYSINDDTSPFGMIKKTFIFLTEKLSDENNNKIVSILSNNHLTVYRRAGMILADVPVQTIDRRVERIKRQKTKEQILAKTKPQGLPVTNIDECLNFLKGNELSSITFMPNEYSIQFKDIPVRICFDAESSSFPEKIRYSTDSQQLTVGKYTKLTLKPKDSGTLLLSICCWENTIEEDIEKLPELRSLAPDTYFVRKRYPRHFDSKAMVILSGKIGSGDKNKIIDMIKKFPKYTIYVDNNMIVAWQEGTLIQ